MDFISCADKDGFRKSSHISSLGFYINVSIYDYHILSYMTLTPEKESTYSFIVVTFSILRYCVKLSKQLFDHNNQPYE